MDGGLSQNHNLNSFIAIKSIHRFYYASGLLIPAPQLNYTHVSPLYRLLQSLFGDPGVLSEIESIRESLDTGTDIAAEVSVHSIAQTLLGLLEALREPVVPGDLFPRVSPLDVTRLPTFRCKRSHHPSSSLVTSSLIL